MQVAAQRVELVCAACVLSYLQCAQEISTRQCSAARHSALVRRVCINSSFCHLHLHHHLHLLLHPHLHHQAQEIPMPTCARCCRAILRATKRASSPHKRQAPAAHSPSTFAASFPRRRRCQVIAAFYCSASLKQRYFRLRAWYSIWPRMRRRQSRAPMCGVFGAAFALYKHRVPCDARL
jgi:hypothetical protein